MPKKGKQKPVFSEEPALGLFSRPSYLSLGDPYDKKGQRDARYIGKQFLGSVPKAGKTLDSFFEKKFTPLFRDEKYMEPSAYERQMRSKAAQSNLGGPWKPSNPPKEQSGSGSMYATMGPLPPHEPEYRVSMPGDGPVLPDSTVHKNFVTNPARKGGPGTATRYVGQPPPGYESAPAKDEDAARTKARLEAKKKMLAGPFRSMVTPPVVFDNNKVFSPAPEIVRKKSKRARSSNSIPTKPLHGPWKYPAFVSERQNLHDTTFSPFPKYESDPIDQMEKKAKARENKLQPIAGVFRTTPTPPGTLPSRPISRPKTSKY
eukprot:comp19560_c0_seq1/m.37305 comp19560_c0_seq1/g.37305  ORF comp19560_c0_seq1/g.37305 comp19560_c0_seq1/m.37305 type:complete len:317 (-) comp19560_c0_seq1:41-991(-)